MKRIIVVFLLAMGSAYGQPEGKYLLNLNGAFVTSDGDVETAIKVGFGVFNKRRTVAGGIEAGYGFLIDNRSTLNVFEVGPFVRSYIYRNQATGLFISGGIAYANARDEDSNIYQSMLFGPDIGFNVHVGSKSAVEIITGYRFQSEIGGDNTSAAIFTRLGVVLFL